MVTNEKPYVLVNQGGHIEWLGLADSEETVWYIALGWPSPIERAKRRAEGWYVAKAKVTWEKP